MIQNQPPREDADEVSPATSLQATEHQSESERPDLPEELEDEADLEDEGESGYIQIRTPLFALGATIVSILLLVLLAGNLYQFVHHRAEENIATVNGAPITQQEFDRAAGSQDQALQSLIDQKLIQQEAKRQKVTIPDSEINSEVDTIKQQLGSQKEFAAALQRANLTEPQLRDQIRTQKLATKLGANGVNVSDDEVQTYFNQNKAQFGTQTLDQAKDQIKAQLLQTKQNEAIQTWVAGLKQKAKITVHIPS